MVWQDESFLGSGELYVEAFDADGNPTGELDVGNATDFFVRAPELETIELLARQAAGHLQASDVRCVVRSQELGFTLSDINRENLALAMFGSAAALTQSAGDNLAGAESVTGYTGRWTKLAARSLDPAAPPVVRNEAGTVTYAEGTDYEVDCQVGRIRVLSGGAIANGATLHVGATWLAVDGWRISGDTAARTMAALRLVGRDQSSDRDCEVIVHRAFLQSAGDIAWLGSEMASLAFTGRILAAAAGTWDVLFP